MWSFLFEGIFIYNMLLEGSVMQVKKAQRNEPFKLNENLENFAFLLFIVLELQYSLSDL